MEPVLSDDELKAIRKLLATNGGRFDWDGKVSVFWAGKAVRHIDCRWRVGISRIHGQRSSQRGTQPIRDEQRSNRGRP